MSKGAKFVIILTFLAFALSPVLAISAEDYSMGRGDDTVNNQTIIRLFWGLGCPHCAAEKAFLAKLLPKYTNVRVFYHEIYYNKSNQELFKKLAKACNEEARGVPTTFIGDDVIIGFGSEANTGVRIEKDIQKCISQGGCPDPLYKTKSLETKTCDKKKGENNLINIPLLGRVNTTQLSLPSFTIVLAAMDSINPCAFFVLMFLLSMLVYAKSRFRMLAIGGTFVFFSGLIYFLFMTAWLNIFILAGTLKVVTLIAGCVAVLIALINIKDYFAFKQGISLTIPEWAKPRLFKKIRAMLKSKSTLSMLIATIILAISANTYELLCTAGFPMVFTRILTLHNLSVLSYYSYLVFYNIVYVVPLAIIVLLFTFTLGAKKLTEEQGKVLKLLSGLMMLGLGLLLILNPGLLNNIVSAIALLALAFGTTGLVVFCKRLRKRRNKNG